MRNIPQLLPRLGDHFIRNVNAMDLAEMPAHRQQQPPRSAANFKRPPRGKWSVRRKPLQLSFKIADDIGSSGKKLRFILFSPSERDIVVRVFTRALIPLRAHALLDRVVLPWLHGVILRGSRFLLGPELYSGNGGIE